MELSQQNPQPKRIEKRRNSSWDLPLAVYEGGVDQRSYSCNCMCAVILVTVIVIFVTGIAIVTMGVTTAAMIFG